MPWSTSNFFLSSGFWFFFFYLGFGDLCNLLTGIGESGEEIFDWTFGFLSEGKRVPLDWADM